MSRPVRFNVHTVPADTKNSISMVDMPAGHTGEGFFATKLSDVVGLGQKEFHLAPAFCHFLLRNRIYGHHGLSL